MSWELKDNELTAADLLAFRSVAGWSPRSLAQAERAVAASLRTVTAVEDGRVVGIGRLIGDGAIHCYLQDIIVLPDARSQGVGRAIVERLLEFVRTATAPGDTITVALMAAPGREAFYRSLGFIDRPNDYQGAGMELKITGDAAGGIHHQE